jgi:hypothetical protein
LKRHALVCKSVERNTCPVCIVTFGTRQKLYHHRRKGGCIPAVNAIDVGVGGGEQQKQQKLSFKRENVAHLVSDASRMDSYIKLCNSAIPVYVRDRFFDISRPENCTVVMRNIRDGFIQIRNVHGDWESKQKKDVIADMIYFAVSDLSEHCDNSRRCHVSDFSKDSFRRMLKISQGEGSKRAARADLEKDVLAVVLDFSRAHRSEVV